MTKNVKISLFDISRSDDTQPLIDTLDEFESMSLEKRLRTDVRLEKIEKQVADRVIHAEAYHLNFTKVRSIGPGKMAANSPISDVGLNPDELFGEETAALYLPSREWLLVMNNHYGVGPSRMATYFGAVDPGSSRHFFYSVSPRIDQSALQKMKAMKTFSSVEITANVGAFDTGEVVGESVFEATSGMNAHRLSLILSANEAHKKGNVLNTKALRGLIDRLLTKGDDVTKMVVKSADDMATEQDRFVDLIEHKLCKTYADRELKVHNHRYTFESKIQLLRRACRGWLDHLT